MKIVKYFGMIALVMSMLVFTGCSSDDEESDGVGDVTVLVGGEWILTRLEGWEPCREHGRDDLTEDVPANEAEYITFYNDGSCNIRYIDTPEYSKKRTYSFNQNAKILEIDNFSYNVRTLTKSRLVIVSGDENDQKDGYLKRIYRR